MTHLEAEKSILNGNLFNTLYALQVSKNRRFRSTFTLVFINAPPNNLAHWETYLPSKIRDTDIAFRFPAPEPYQILLTNAYEGEAEIFVARIFEGWRGAGYDSTGMAASILKISSGHAPIQKVVQVGRKALKSALSTAVTPPYVLINEFATREQVLIKVSILEEDPIVKRILSNFLERSVIEEVEIDLRIFQDGVEFLESDWYQSAHTHVVIMNDILPRKNGIDVLHALRKMPNHHKFHIFMMTKRTSEEEMIYAYEHGIDEYIIKPFNPKLFEAQIKKVLGRLSI